MTVNLNYAHELGGWLIADGSQPMCELCVPISRGWRLIQNEDSGEVRREAVSRAREQTAALHGTTESRRERGDEEAVCCVVALRT